MYIEYVYGLFMYIKLTRYLQSCFSTILCVKWTFASLSSAVIFSTVEMIYTFYGVRTTRCLDFFSVMVPQKVPSRGDVNCAVKGDGLSREHNIFSV